MDTFTEFLTAFLIEISRFPKILKFLKIIPSYEKWEKGKKLKILLVGYNGARNTGADVRVEGIVRQFYHILGEENVHIGIMTLSKSLTEVYFKPPTELIEFSSIFFLPLLRNCSSYHIAVLSEGSCFKSKFANALTTFFFGASGIMRSQKKPCIAYGSEAGEMDNLLKKFVKHYCKNTYVISRTEPSRKIVQELGLSGEIGTDTAWIFPPGDKKLAEEILRKNGWDGNKPLLGIAVINPFYWPVKPNLLKFIKMKLLKEKREDNYDKWYFFSTSPEREKKFEIYLSGIAKAADEFVEKHNFFPVIIGMEKLDYNACYRLREKMKNKPPVFWSGEYDGYQMTAILHLLSLLVTSRYHARVLSMTGGVPSIAISMDERLENLLKETGHFEEYYISCDDENIGNKLLPMLEKLWNNREKVRKEILEKIPSYLEKMGKMGKTFKNFLRENFKGIELKDDPENIFEFLPPLYPELKEIVGVFLKK
jgi:polysaccharide pyruvyl transferase WcaK-like protein